MDERAQQLLKIVNEQGRKASEGKLTIFLGMVAGVGKTYAMLSQGKALLASGKNVVIGYLEAHGRQETENLGDGMEQVPRKVISYKGRNFEEMDLEAIIAKRPQLVLVDELAHTNVPGAKHQKRYQDVLEILQNGLDVFATLNVQHVESCSNVVRDITNVKVAETLPDMMIDRADEIILIDLAPEQVLKRLNEGKIYKSEKINDALNNFFTNSNLTALRELVLRLLADKMNSNLRDFKIVRGVPQIWKIGHRLLVPIDASKESENSIRIARRLATNLNAHWYCAWVETQSKRTPEEEAQIKKNFTLARQLGAEVISVMDFQEETGLLRLAKSYQINQIILSKEKFLGKNRWQLGTNLGRILAQSLDIDILLVGGASQQSRKLNAFLVWHPFKLNLKALLFTLVQILAVTLIGEFFFPEEKYQMVGMIYLLFLNLHSLYSSRESILFACVLTGVLWNFLFIPPHFTFAINRPEDWMLTVGFVMVSIIMGLLTSQLRKKEMILMANDQKLSILYFLIKNISETRGPEKIVRICLDKIFELFPVYAGVMLARDPATKKLEQNVIGNLQIDEKEFNVANWAFANNKSAGKYSETLSSVEGMYLPLSVGMSCYGVLGIIPKNKNHLQSDQLLILSDIARHMALGLEREILNENAQKVKIDDAIEKVYRTLLSSVSVELKTPLASIQQMATALVAKNSLERPEAIKELSQSIMQGTHQMQLLVENLLDMSSIDAGHMVLNKKVCNLRSIINSVVADLEGHFEQNRINVVFEPNEIPLVEVDGKLFQQAIRNILQNACQYSPVGDPIEVKLIHTMNGLFMITIRDYGPGVPLEDPSLVFQKFYRHQNSVPGGTGLGLTIAKEILSLHGAEIIAENAVGGGAKFTIKLLVKKNKERL
jgi:two-component system sensor histidine kinase KdpD